jgi:hypothetical protein
LSEKQKFQEILEEIRNDIEFVKSNLFNELSKLVLGTISRKDYGLYGVFYNKFSVRKDVKDWIFDFFLDKFYETCAKHAKIVKDLGYNVKLPEDGVKNATEKLAFGTFELYNQVENALNQVHSSIEKYETSFESILSSIRRNLYEEDWSRVKNLKAIDYVLPIQRARYVSAREELEKAKQAVKDKQWDEVLNHLRPAIDLALKEKFGFKRINPMKQFLVEAEKFGLPLPTYTMLYDYFDEGSQRIHSGKLNTPYECQKALEFVAGFIDQLDLMDISKEKIEEFKKGCRCVE